MFSPYKCVGGGEAAPGVNGAVHLDATNNGGWDNQSYRASANSNRGVGVGAAEQAPWLDGAEPSRVSGYDARRDQQELAAVIISQFSLQVTCE